jgi:hypothetical protein
MRNVFQLFALFFFFPLSLEESKKILLILLFFGLSCPTKNFRFLFSRKHLSLSGLSPPLYIQIFCFAFFSNQQGGVFDISIFENSRDTLSRTFRMSSFSHTNFHLHVYINNNVCCYSTNRVRRRPQGHQGSSTCLFLSFSFPDPIRSDRARARASSSSSRNYLFAYPTLYTIRENKMQNDTLSL